MSQQIIDISTPDDGLGDVLRTGFDKTNQNFTELYSGKVDKIAGKGLSENDFTDPDKTKLDGIESGAQVNVNADFSETDPTSDSFILNKPPSLYASVGHFHYNDLATHTTPLVVLPSVPKKLTNDTLGVGTEKDFAPYGVADVWEATDNAFTFSPLDLGDQAKIRFDFLLSSTSPSQTFSLYVKFGVGSPSEYDMLVSSWVEKDVITYGQIIRYISFSIDNEDWLFNPVEIYILSDDDANVKVNGWYVPIIRKSVNVIDFNSDPLKLDKVSIEGVERAYIINADGSQGTKPTSEFKDVLEFANLASFPVTGEIGKIYLALDTNKTYRWSGSAYVQIGGVVPSYTVIGSNVSDSSPVTGTTAITTVETFVIPANTFKVGDVILFRCRIIKTGAAGAVSHRHSVGGFNVFFQTSGIFSQVERTLVVKSATVTQDVSNLVTAVTSSGGYSSIGNLNINWTLPQNLIIALNNQSAADSSLVSFWELSRIRKN